MSWKKRRERLKDSVGISFSTSLYKPAAAENLQTGMPQRKDRGEFTRVRLRGHFDDKSSVLMGPYSVPNCTAEYENPSSEKTGFYVFSPFYVESTTDQKAQDHEIEKPLMVSRGWFPKSKVSAYYSRIHDASNASGSTQGRRIVEFEGVVRQGHATKPNRFLPDPNKDKRQFFYTNIDDMRRFWGMDGYHDPCMNQYFIECLPHNDRPSQPGAIDDELVRKPLDAHMDFYVKPFTHQAYAATWFTLSAAGVFLTWLRFLK